MHQLHLRATELAEIEQRVETELRAEVELEQQVEVALELLAVAGQQVVVTPQLAW